MQNNKAIRLRPIPLDDWCSYKKESSESYPSTHLCLFFSSSKYTSKKGHIKAEHQETNWLHSGNVSLQLSLFADTLSVDL